MTEYYHTLMGKGGRVLRSYGDVVLETDYQILGHKDNEAQTPPDKQWVGWKTVPYPAPTFVRMPPGDV